MNSLVCIEHLNFDGTLEKIKTDGGKVGSGQDIILQLLNILLNNFQKYLAWVHDKITANLLYLVFSGRGALFQLTFGKQEIIPAMSLRAYILMLIVKARAVL